MKSQNKFTDNKVPLRNIHVVSFCCWRNHVIDEEIFEFRVPKDTTDEMIEEMIKEKLKVLLPNATNTIWSSKDILE